MVRRLLTASSPRAPAHSPEAQASSSPWLPAGPSMEVKTQELEAVFD